MTGDKIVRVEVIVKNNQLAALISPYGSVAEFCKLIKVSRSTVDKLLGLQCTPYDKRGGYREIVMKIAEHAGQEPTEIFPDWIYERVITPKVATSISLEQVVQLQQSVARLSQIETSDVDFEIQPENIKKLILGQKGACDA